MPETTVDDGYIRESPKEDYKFRRGRKPNGSVEPLLHAQPPAQRQVGPRIDFVHFDGKKPILTIENLKLLLDFYHVAIRYNLFSKRNEIMIPDLQYTYENRTEKTEAWLLSKLAQHGLKAAHFADFVSFLGDENLYNPVRTWIESKPWDGQSRIKQFLETVKARDTIMRDALITRWMILAVAAAFQPNGIDAGGMLVFQGQQHRGKTKWFKALVDNPEIKQYIKGGMSIDPRNRDSVIACLSHWLVELGELDATLSRTEISSLKAFLTEEVDVQRLCYGRREKHFCRRTVFYASVNANVYLQDPTGNRRFWTVEVDSCDDEHGLDMQQIWAEFATLYNEGENWALSREEVAAVNEVNVALTVTEPLVDQLLMKYNWEEGAYCRFLSSTEILREIGYIRPTKQEAATCGNTVNHLNKGQRKRANGRTLYALPFPKTLTEENLYAG